MRSYDGVLSLTDGSLHSGAVRHSLIGVDALVELLAVEEVLEELLHLGDTRRATDEHGLDPQGTLCCSWFSSARWPALPPRRMLLSHERPQVPSTTRTLVAVSNALGLNLDHLDVAVAYLNGVLPRHAGSRAQSGHLPL